MTTKEGATSKVRVVFNFEIRKKKVGKEFCRKYCTVHCISKAAKSLSLSEQVAADLNLI